MINDLIKRKNITRYRLSKESGVPYTTINDICNQKTRLNKASAETVYRLAKVLDIPMEILVEYYLDSRNDFELFKSNVCHRVKVLGDIEFIIETLEKDDIRTFYRKQWYRESLYLLAMLDYISRVNEVPLCTGYNDLRNCRLEHTLFPAGILATAAVLKDERIKEEALKKAIPEFLRFNIVENEVRDLV